MNTHTHTHTHTHAQKEIAIWCILMFQEGHRVNMKESEKIDKYWDLAKVQKKQWNMKVVKILIIVGELRTVSKGLEKNLTELKI